MQFHLIQSLILKFTTGIFLYFSKIVKKLPMQFVVDDVAELGDDTNKYHQELGDYIKKAQIDFTLAVGRHTKITMQQLDKNAFWFDTKDNLLKKLLKIIDHKTIILIKGSRFMKMEEVVSKII